MKKRIFLLFILIAQLSLAQEFKEGDLIHFITPVKHERTNTTNQTENFNPSDTTVNYLEAGYDFVIVNATNNGQQYTLLPLNFVSDTNLKINRADYYNDKLFNVEKEDMMYAKKSGQQTEKWSVGLLTLPFKYRTNKYGQTNVFTTEFNVNSTLSFKTTTSIAEASVLIQIGVGTGTINLNATNADPSIPSINANIFSGFWGIMLAFNKTQAGLYFGQDYIDNQAHYRWKYHGKTWVGIGIGFDVFKPKKPTQLTNQSKL